MGNFLQATDLQDIFEVRKDNNDRSSSSNTTNSKQPQPNSVVRRPCWYPYATEGLCLKLKVNDDQGGRLSLRGEEELLRRQKFKCLGCGEPLQSLFFGLDQNYQPCRYTGGLFCKRWCHSNDHRVIPHRMLLYWDCVPHRVCQQVSKFLDIVLDKPILNLNSINSLLYEGIPYLNNLKNLRLRATSVLETMLEFDPERALDITSSILQKYIYLVVAHDYFSMKDLISIDRQPELHRLLSFYIKKLIEINPGSFYSMDEVDLNEIDNSPNVFLDLFKNFSEILFST